MNQEQLRQISPKDSANQATLEKNTIEQEHAATKHSYGEHTKKPQEQQEQSHNNHQEPDSASNHQDLLDPGHDRKAQQE